MKSVSTKFLAIFLLLLSETEYAFGYHPSTETIIFNPPADYSMHLKELIREIVLGKGIERSKIDYGLVERIPLDQNKHRWSLMISMQYFDRSSWDEHASIEDFVKLCEKSARDRYPGNEVTWKIIEKNKNDIIYEWILHKTYLLIPPQHEVVRAFLTDKGLHRFACVRQYNEMDKDEKERCLKSFENLYL
jgi:hypothetical protein